MPRDYEVVLLGAGRVMHDINDAGVCIGDGTGADGSTRAVTASGGRFAELGTLGGSASSARGINDAGVIVGGALTADDRDHHGFVFAQGVMRDLNALVDRRLGWEIIHALGINNRGEIVAIACRDGVDHVVVLRPR